MIDSEQTITKKEVLSIAVRYIDSESIMQERYLSLEEMSGLDS